MNTEKIVKKPAKAYPLAVGRRRRYLFSRFDVPNLKVLELGALNMPLFEPEETSVSYMDYYSDEEFRELSKSKALSRPLEELVSVNHVCKDKYFSAGIDEYYDLILASHVIEHVPDPIAWLGELSELLTDNGSIFLAIPDRRYTFDYLRRETTPFDLLKAFRNGAVAPDLYTVADFFYFMRDIRAAEIWGNPDLLTEKIAAPGMSLPDAMNRAERSMSAGAEHLEIHCNVFSYPSFATLWKGIGETGLLPLDLVETVDVMRDANEFWVLLRRKPVAEAKNRRPTKGRKFLIGRNGQYFLDNDTNNTIAQMTGKASLSKNDQGRWERLIRSRQILLSDQNVGYRFVIAPAKEAVLAEHLPEGLTLSDNRPAMQLAQSSKITSVLRYPLAVMRDLGTRGFTKGDTHWSDLGGLIVFRSIMSDLVEPMGLQLPEISDFELKTFEAMGDLSVHVKGQEPEIVSRLSLRAPQHRIVLNNRQPNRGNMIVTENASVSTGTVLVFRDSFSEVLIPYFAETFSKCVFIWNPFVDYDFIEELKPKLVFNIMAERFLPIVPDDIHKFSWEQIEIMKRAQG